MTRINTGPTNIWAFEAPPVFREATGNIYRRPRLHQMDLPIPEPPTPEPRTPRRAPKPRKGTVNRWMLDHGINYKFERCDTRVTGSTPVHWHCFHKDKTLVVLRYSRKCRRSALRDLVVRVDTDPKVRDKMVKAFGEQACNDLAALFGFNSMFSKEKAS